MVESKRTKEPRPAALEKVAALEDTICVLMFERANDAKTAALRESRFDERIGGLEKEISNLNEHITILEAENAQLLAQPSSSHFSTYLDVLWDFHKKWIQAEA